MSTPDISRASSPGQDLSPTLSTEAPQVQPASENTAYVIVRRVRKTYASRAGEVEALQDVTFEVRRGGFVSIVGPSGCGKSTLLKLILGVVPPSAGEIVVDDSLVTGPQRNIGMVFQSAVLLPWRSVLRNVLLPVDVIGLDRQRYTERALALLDRVGLADFRDHRPEELSGGMQQRVAICRALIHDPPLVLLDEPFGALDSITREQLNGDVLKIWRDTGKTVLLVTHSVEEAVFMSNDVIVMSARPGSILEQVRINLPRPRSMRIKGTPEFIKDTLAIRQMLGISDPQD